MKDGVKVNEKILGNRYALLEKIGEGGMAKVYKARCNILNRIVAVKILKDEYAKDEEFLNKFKNEALSAASLNHPNIINVFDVGEDDGISYIVMEFVDGKNLKELINEQGAIPEKKSLEIVRQIALALSEAHSKKIIHKDIKPHNIMITKDNLVKVGDFGIAKASTSSTITSTDTVLGSVHYFSPEQARGGYMDERSDIYSLGIVLYELLTGRVPFNGDTPVNVALKHIHSKVELPQDMMQKISEGTQKILKNLTQRNVDRRYKSADEIIRDIESLRNNRQISYKDNQQDFETKKILFGQKDLDELDVAFDDDEDDDYEENYTVKKNKAPVKTKKASAKHSKLTVILAVIAALIASVIFLGTVFLFSGGDISKLNPLGFLSSDRIELPSFLGMTVEEAETEAEKLGITIEKTAEEPNSRYAEGTISKQDPQEGFKAEKGQVVKVVISKTEEELFAVPSVEGMTLTEAVQLLQNDDFDEAVEYQYTEDPEDTVLSQVPAAGEKAQKGSVVRLIVSRGPEEILEKVPNLIGKTLDQAKNEMGNFKAGEVSYNEDKSKKDGVVLSQIPKPDTETRQGSEINLVINKIAQEPVVATKQNRMVIVLPDQEEISVQIRDLSTGAIVFDRKVFPQQINGVLAVDIIGKSGETKEYEIYIDSQYYATQPVTF